MFKEIISTPIRPVLDASSNTPKNLDGSGGKSLNDACMKGKIPDMNLLRMVLGTITALIYGVKSVAAQSEAGIRKLANFIQAKHPDLAEFLLQSRYVDDLGDSRSTLEEM